MAVTVRVVGDLTRFMSADRVRLDGSGWTLAAALEELMRLHPALRGQLFDDHMRIHYALVMMAGGRPVAWPKDRDTAVKDGDELLLTRFHSGG